MDYKELLVEDVAKLEESKEKMKEEGGETLSLWKKSIWTV